jgi:hypothetical protein
VSIAALVAAASCFNTSAHAQPGVSLDLDPSIRASGMGRASGAVFWDATNAWANPALLGYQKGIRYEWGRTALVPDLASTVSFETETWKFGAGGLGFSASGNPVGRTQLDFGQGEGGEDVESWGFGVNAFELTEALVRLAGGHMRRFARVADVSFGMNSKHLDASLGPDLSGSATAHDYGLLARITALDHHADNGGVPMRLDLSYGYSVLSYDDAFLFGSSVSRHHRSAYAGRTTIDWRQSANPRDAFVGWLRTGFAPIAALSFAYDTDRITAGDNNSPYATYDTKGRGSEVTLLNCVSFRVGQYTDKEGDIDGQTWGWSAGLPFGRGAGVRYDWASVPEAAGLTDVHRHGITAWLDLREAVKSARGE